jgi:hypothetical protein
MPLEPIVDTPYAVPPSASTTAMVAITFAYVRLARRDRTRILVLQ